MGPVITYENTLCAALGKRGVMKPIDASGYYAINMGGLDVYNESGAFYVADTAKDLFKSSSHLMRRINGGKLYNELGHPKREAGMSDQDYLIRILTVYENNACSHTRRIHLEEVSNANLNNGRPFIQIIGEVKPMGQLGILVEDTFKNADSDACYSIRSITNDQFIGNVRHKHLQEVATWDYVLEPGIRHATKYHTASAESLTINVRTLESALDQIKSETGYGMESTNASHHVERLLAIAKESEQRARRSIFVPPTSKW